MGEGEEDVEVDITTILEEYVGNSKRRFGARDGAALSAGWLYLCSLSINVIVG